jgi:microcystin degradation protein MlrC
MAGEIRPVTAKVEIPALVRGDELITATGVFGRFVGRAVGFEKSGEALAAGMFIGNPFTDVPELRSYAVVTTDGDAAKAEREALALARDFWAERRRMQARLTSPAESVRQATELLQNGPPGTVAMVDAADATSSGASGDGNAVIRALLEAGYPGRILAPIVDPAAVEAAFAAGVGTTVKTTVGGGLDRRRFTPLPIEARVRLLSDGRFRSESFNQEWYSGRTALLQAGNLTLVVTSRPVHLFDRSLFYAHGCDPRNFDLVVVKSPHCQHHMYADWCRAMINVDAPGSTSANLPTLGHTVCRRPVFPLDDITDYQPRAKIFSRRTS